MPVGSEVFETCYFIGKMMGVCEMWDTFVVPVYRKDIKMHLCGQTKAKDGNIRQALLDKYGIQGKKKTPGPTYGISEDVWSALAVADLGYAKIESNHIF
jgi:hypothetical protein